jgi:hypothetical protein
VSGPKSFCPKLYEANNQKGIKTAISLLTQLGYVVTDTKEAYADRDFIVEKNGTQLKIEVEVSRSWKTRHFPFPFLTVPYRKNKSGADIYIMVNAEETSCMVGKMVDVKKSRVDAKWTNLCKIYEDFFFCETSLFQLWQRPHPDSTTTTNKWSNTSSTRLSDPL